jgi:putative membrane protein
MKLIAEILVGIVALEHLYFLWMEMFSWTTMGPRTFKNFPVDLFEKTKEIAANQGLYNGFLAAGLIWSLLITDEAWSTNVSYFFLTCVIIAGIFGATTVEKSILFKQAVPAILAFAFTITAQLV